MCAIKLVRKLVRKKRQNIEKPVKSRVLRRKYRKMKLGIVGF